jgi:hypothetical protein
MKAETVAIVAGCVGAYLTLNVVGTVYYTKLNSVRGISFNEQSWDLSSVLLGWLVFPLFNLASPISYAVHK